MKFGADENGFGVSHGWRVVWISFHWPNDWRWGFESFWYDGPQSILNLGPIAVYWNWGNDDLLDK